MAFKDRDFLLVDYTATVKETGAVIETTIYEKAKEANILEEGKTYEPALVIIGEGRIVKGLEEALKEMSEGEEKTVEVPPAKAYGERDPTKLRRLPLREFKRENIEPIPGKLIEINGIPAVIRDVSGGRVLVDYNHPLAGKTIVYQVKVVKQLSTDEDKVKALVKRRLKPKDLSKYSIKISKEEGSIEIKIPQEDMLNPDIQLAKRALSREILNYIDGMKRVVFIEEIVKEEKKEEQAKSSEPASEQSQGEQNK